MRPLPCGFGTLAALWYLASTGECCQPYDEGYSIIVRNQCTSNNGPVHLHVLATAGSATGLSNAEEGWSQWHLDNSFYLDAPITNGTLGQINFTPAVIDGALSSRWRMWWDDIARSNGSRAQTLLEVNCDGYAERNATLQCYVDVSVVDGFSSTVVATFPSGQLPDISAVPVANWTCPVANRLPPGSAFPTPFLPETVACLSNCTVYGTESACCTGSYNNTNTCPQPNAALAAGVPSAYSFAYDDSNALKSFRTALGETPFRVTTCV